MLLELELLQIICQGIDPRTGEVLDTPRDPSLDKARLKYLDEMKRASNAANKKQKATRRRKISNVVDPKLSNRGKPWLPEDDSSLPIEWAKGGTLEHLASIYCRSPGAVAARLVFLSQIVDTETARALNVARGGEYGNIPQDADEIAPEVT